MRRSLAALLSACLTLSSFPAQAAGVVSVPEQGGVPVIPGLAVPVQLHLGAAVRSPLIQGNNLRSQTPLSYHGLRSGLTPLSLNGVRPPDSGFTPADTDTTGQAILSSLSEELGTISPSDPVTVKEIQDRAFTKTRESSPLLVVSAVQGFSAPTRGFFSPNGAAKKKPVAKAEKPAKDEKPAEPPSAEPALTPVDLGEPSYEFDKMFELTRKLLTRQEVRVFLREAFREELEITPEMQEKYGLPEKTKELSESQFLFLLQYNSKHWPLLEQYLTEMAKLDKKDQESAKVAEKSAEWRAKFRELLAKKDVSRVFKVLNDPTKPVQLRLPTDKAGYRNVRVFANHLTVKNGQEVPAQDLKKVALDFIAGARKQLMLNVFDFDLMDVADALAAKAADGVEVTVGIDKGVIEARPEVKAVFERLKKAKGVEVVAVDSVGLNHQKLFTRDWDDPEAAATLFSSGNLTQSCVGAEGDLKSVKDRPADSVPNANHMIVVEGWLAAQVSAHSLTKTLVMKLRGDEYPLGGAVKIFGPKAANEKDRNYIVLAFSPKGGLGDVNRDITQRALLDSRGPVRMMQFAFSSQSLQEAIVERARLEKKDGKAFDFKSVGDTPFAVRPWSVFLGLSGYEFEEDKEPKRYVKADKPALKDALGAEAFEAVKKDIRIGPAAYRNHVYTPKEGEKVQYNSKIHHKVMISGPVAIAGTSFNFSENANSNNEQFVLFKDPEVVAEMNAVFDGLFKQTQTSVEAEALRRNEMFKNQEKVDDDDDVESRRVDEEGRKSRAPRPKASNGAAGMRVKLFSDPVFMAEVKRKAFHQATLVYLAGYHWLGAEKSLYAVSAWFASLAIVETLRLRSTTVRAMFQKAFGPLIREKEANRYTGAFYTSLGIGGVLFLYGSNPLVVTASILYLAFGDAASALAGRAFGRHTYQIWGQTRSWEGTAAGLITALGVGVLVGLSPVLTVIGALAFLTADTLPLPPDDNLWIPLITATTLFLLG